MSESRSDGKLSKDVGGAERSVSLEALSRASCAASGILYQVMEGAHLAVCVGDRKRFEMTHRPKRVHAHHTHMHARTRTNVASPMYCHAKCCGGSDLDSVAKGKVRTRREEEQWDEKSLR